MGEVAGASPVSPINRRMKQCTRCGRSDVQFGKNKSQPDGLQLYCKECNKLACRAYYANSPARRAKISEYKKRVTAACREYVIQYLKTHPCVDCGESDIIVLEFDHLRDKRASIADMMHGRCALKTIKAEIQKCEVRCANCHRRKTAKQLGLFKLMVTVA